MVFAFSGMTSINGDVRGCVPKSDYTHFATCQSINFLTPDYVNVCNSNVDCEWMDPANMGNADSLKAAQLYAIYQCERQSFQDQFSASDSYPEPQYETSVCRLMVTDTRIKYSLSVGASLRSRAATQSDSDEYVAECRRDFDEDGIPDNLDTDDDNDSVLDSEELSRISKVFFVSNGNLSGVFGDSNRSDYTVSGTLTVMPNVPYLLTFEALLNDFVGPTSRLKYLSIDGVNVPDETLYSDNPNVACEFRSVRENDCFFKPCNRSAPVKVLSASGTVQIEAKFEATSWKCNCNPNNWECDATTTTSANAVVNPTENGAGFVAITAALRTNLYVDKSVSACDGTSGTCKTFSSLTDEERKNITNPYNAVSGNTNECDGGPGYYSTKCEECPGGAGSSACGGTNAGVCSDGRSGDGTCTCNTGYELDSNGSCKFRCDSPNCVTNMSICYTDGSGATCLLCKTGYKKDTSSQCTLCADGYAALESDSSLCGLDSDSNGTADVDDDCSPDPCSGHGQCSDLVGTFSCACENGYYGHDCANTCASVANCDDSNVTCTSASNSTCLSCQFGYTLSSDKTACNNPCDNLICGGGDSSKGVCVQPGPLPDNCVECHPTPGTCLCAAEWSGSDDCTVCAEGYTCGSLSLQFSQNNQLTPTPSPGPTQCSSFSQASTKCTNMNNTKSVSAASLEDCTKYCEKKSLKSNQTACCYYNKNEDYCKFLKGENVRSASNQTRYAAMCVPRASCSGNPSIVNINEATSSCDGTEAGATCAYKCNTGYYATKTALCTDNNSPSWNNSISISGKCQQCYSVTNCVFGKETCTTATDSKCTECNDGYYGENCTTCPAIVNCESGITCTDLSDGKCSQCAAGYYGDQCSQCTAVPHCDGSVTCTSSSNSVCSKCAEGYIGDGSGGCLQCTSVDHCNDRATSVTSNESRNTCVCSVCKRGWFGDVCNSTGRASCLGGDHTNAGQVADPNGGGTLGSCTCKAGYYGSPQWSFENLEWSQDACTACTAVLNCNGNLTCSDASDSVCSQCATGYSGDKCDSCIAGYGFTEQSTCEACVGNTYSDVVDQTPCRAHSSCPSGMGKAIEGSATATLTCEQCNSPFYSAGDSYDACFDASLVDAIDYASSSSVTCAVGYTGTPVYDVGGTVEESGNGGGNDPSIHSGKYVSGCEQCVQIANCEGVVSCSTSPSDSTCSKCALGYIQADQGATCKQCTSLEHCFDKATAVTSNDARNACICSSCKRGWYGPDCNTNGRNSCIGLGLTGHGQQDDPNGGGSLGHCYCQTVY
eukprot:g3093.t1